MTNKMRMSSLIGIGTASPAGIILQEQSCDHAKQICSTSLEQSLILERLYKRTSIRSRGTVLASSKNPGGSEGGEEFYWPKRNNIDAGPTTAKRMERYEKDVLPLALEAATIALDEANQAGVSKGSIAQIVTVSCTGFSAPGFDVRLVEELGLNRNVGRTHIGFMGCHGALNALRVASSFCRSGEGPVLLCASELCSLHFQYGWQNDSLLANALFSDGAAAIVISNDSEIASWNHQASSSFIVPNSLEAMTWKIGDNGFQMTISSKVPGLIKENLKGHLEGFLNANNLTLSEISSWAIHPGGPRILDAVQECLCLSDFAMEPSRDVLACHGNMSSPTVFFIVKRLQKLNYVPPCVVLGFGPGLTIEMALLT